MITFFVINGILFGIAVLLLIAEKLLITYGDCSVIVNADKKIPVPGGETLLTYLNENKIFIPSACGGKATCGFLQNQSGCRCRKDTPNRRSLYQ